MERLKGELQDKQGNVLYPHTSSDIVFGKDGKSVEKQINAISDETTKIGKGKSLKWVTSGSCDDLKYGEYYCTPEVLGLPTKSAYYLECHYVSDDYLYQKFKEQNSGVIKERHKSSGVWSDWTPIATTTKTDILFAPSLGYSVQINNTVKINNVIYVKIALLADAVVATNSKFIIGKLGTTFANRKIVLNVHQGKSGSGDRWGICKCFVESNGDVYFYTQTSDVNNLDINGTIVL